MAYDPISSWSQPADVDPTNPTQQERNRRMMTDQQWQQHLDNPYGAHAPATGAPNEWSTSASFTAPGQASLDGQPLPMPDTSRHFIPYAPTQFATPQSPVEALANALAPKRDEKQQQVNPFLQGLFSLGGGGHAQNLGFVPDALFGE